MRIELLGLAAAGFLQVSLTLLSGCASSPEPAPSYDRPLGSGERALHHIDSERVRGELIEAFDARESGLAVALANSATWYQAPSSQSRFPFATNDGTITHDRARQSVEALREITARAESGRAFATEVLARFDVYQTVGWDSQGTVLFTGYYAPIFKGSLTKSPGFSHPLYTRPNWLLTSKTGVPFGRRMADGSIVDCPNRAEIESSNMLAGLELLWLPSRLDAYLCQVNGSARIELADGKTIHVGYAGKTDRPYTGLGTSMINEGLIPKEGLSLDAIQAFYARDPATVDRLIDRNESFVFFTKYDGANWPAGSLGVPVVERASIATDKSVYPPGAVALVDTTVVNQDKGRAKFVRLVCDQDTGGAIVAPGRCDLFMGIGPEAKVLAGGQYAEGTMYYLFLKPESWAATSGN